MLLARVRVYKKTVAVSEFAECMVLTLDNRGSKLAISKFYKDHHVFTVERTKINKKRPEIGHFRNN